MMLCIILFFCFSISTQGEIVFDFARQVKNKLFEEKKHSNIQSFSALHYHFPMDEIIKRKIDGTSNLQSFSGVQHQFPMIEVIERKIIGTFNGILSEKPPKLVPGVICNALELNGEKSIFPIVSCYAL